MLLNTWACLWVVNGLLYHDPTKNLPNILFAIENQEWLELSFWTVSGKTKWQNYWKIEEKKAIFFGPFVPNHKQKRVFQKKWLFLLPVIFSKFLQNKYNMTRIHNNYWIPSSYQRKKLITEQVSPVFFP